MIEVYAKRKVEKRKIRLINTLNFDSILDLGCGNGAYLPYLKKRAQLVVGLDINRSLMKISQKRGFDVVLATIDRLPFRDKCFSCVWSAEVLEHFPSFDVVNEIERVASKKVVLTLPNPLFPHFKRDPTHILKYSVSSLRARLSQQPRTSKWHYVVRGLGFNEIIPTQIFRQLSTFFTWFLPWLSPTISAIGNYSRTDKEPRVAADVFAYSILESGTMAGGYRIAIELLKSWRRRGNFVFCVHTTSEGQKMMEKYLGQKPNIIYDVVWSPRILTRLCLNHALISVVVNVFMSFQGVIRSVANKAEKSRRIVYSATPFLSDLLPSVVTKLKFSGASLFVSHAMFAPSLFGGGFNATGEKGIPSLRDASFFLNEKLTYSLIKMNADVISETNEIDRARCIADGFPHNRAIAILGGVDVSLSNSVPEAETKEFDAVFIGRLHPQKGITTLIDIWHLVTLKKKNAKLAIIGNGPLEQEVRKKISEYGLEENCKLFGFIDGAEKIKIFKQSKIVVHPALYDSGGMAACEAMICGLPGVSFDLPALRVYYPKGMVKTPCFDLAAFADNILKLLDDPCLHETVRKDAVDWAKEWDWDKSAQVVLNAIEGTFEEATG
jgi:glycosyltransferase involved in cell wall biosynthesis